MRFSSEPGQLLFAGFHGTTAPDDLLRLIKRGRLGGVILFARNIEAPTQLRQLTSELLDAAPPSQPLLISIDQEGGRVQRLRNPWTEWPPMRRIGDYDDLDTTRALARALARELSDCNIHLNFAPVVDVHTNPSNPIIGDRSFGENAAHVAGHACAFIEAMQEVGVAACAKHFPGHGDTATDSHLDLPSVLHNRKRLDEIELLPFRRAVEAGVASIMTAHVLYRPLDARFPATLSKRILDILRKDLAYDGIIFSDDLDMKAMTEHFALEEQVQKGLNAGIDAFLVCNDDSRRDRVLHILEEMPAASLQEPLRRVGELKALYAKREDPRVDEVSLLGPPYPEHQVLAERIA